MIIDELIAVLGYKLDDKGDLKKFDQSLKAIESRARAVGTAIRTMTLWAGAAVAGGFSLLGKGVIDTSAKFETYLTTLETIEGSAEKAKASLDWVQEFAKTTPFDIDQATSAFVKLKAYGIDPLKDNTLKVIGDTASGMGKDLMQAVEAWADAITGENERLKEFGVKAKKEGDNLTYSWVENGKDVSKTVKNNSKDILKFLNETMGKKFGGAMDRQSKTWAGMVSNLGDSWMGFQKLIGDSGFFDAIKAQLRGLLDNIDGWEKDGTLKTFAKTLSDMLTGVVTALSLVMGRIAQHVKFFRENLSTLLPYLKAAGVWLAALMMICRPLLTLWIGLAFALDDLLTYMQGGESVFGNFVTWLRSILPGSEEVKDSLMKLAAYVGGAFVAAFLLAPKAIALGFGKAIIAALALFLTPAGWAVLIAGIGAALVAYFWQDLQAAWPAFKANVESLWQGIKDAVVNFDWVGTGVAIMTGIWNGMKSIGESIKGWFASLVPEWAKGMVGAGGSGPTGSYSPPGAPPDPSRPSAPNFTPPTKPQGTPGPPTPSSEALKNLQGNLDKLGSAKTAPVVSNDHSQDNRQYPITVTAPVTVHVQQAAEAGSNVGAAIGAEISKAIKLQPSRMQTSPAQ